MKPRTMKLTMEDFKKTKEFVDLTKIEHVVVKKTPTRLVAYFMDGDKKIYIHNITVDGKLKDQYLFPDED